MSRQFKIELKDGTIVVIDAPTDEDPESWLRRQPRLIRLYESSYHSEEEIVCVQEFENCIA